MTIKVTYEIDVDDAEAQQATDSQIREWIEFQLGKGCELHHSPISDYEAEIEYLEIKIDRS